MSRPRSEKSSSSSSKDEDSDVEVLAALGYKQEFKRVFHPIELFGVVVSVLCIGPGFSSALVYAIPNGGPVAMIWGWLAVTPFTICIALSLAELASAAPTSGGLYYWTHRFASPRWRNLLAWLVGYVNTLQWIVSVAAVNWATALMVNAGVVIGANPRWSASNGQLYAIFLALCVSEALAASVASAVIARLQWLCILFNVAIVFVLVVGLPAATPRELMNTPAYAFGHFENLTAWPNGFAFILSFLSPLFAFAGYDSPVHLSEEVANARVVVPWTIVAAVGLCSLVGLAINVAIAFCMGTELDSILTNTIHQPMAVVLLNTFGTAGALAVWSMFIVTLWMCAVSNFTAGSRQMFAFARDGALPFSAQLYRMHPRTRTPVACVWLIAALAALLGLLAFAGGTAVSAVFTLVVAGGYVAYLIPIASRFAFRNDFRPGPFSLGKYSSTVGAVAIAWMVFGIVIMLFPTEPAPAAGRMNYAVVVLGGVMLLATVYFYVPKYGGRHWFTGPRRNVVDLGVERTPEPDKLDDDEQFVPRTLEEQPRESDARATEAEIRPKGDEATEVLEEQPCAEEKPREDEAQLARAPLAQEESAAAEAEIQPVWEEATEALEEQAREDEAELPSAPLAWEERAAAEREIRPRRGEVTEVLEEPRAEEQRSEDEVQLVKVPLPCEGREAETRPMWEGAPEALEEPPREDEVQLTRAPLPCEARAAAESEIRPRTIEAQAREDEAELPSAPLAWEGVAAESEIRPGPSEAPEEQESEDEGELPSAPIAWEGAAAEAEIRPRWVAAPEVREAVRVQAVQAEQRAQTKLRDMGVCVQGYKWIKQEGGYRCAGGAHFVHDWQLR